MRALDLAHRRLGTYWSLQIVGWLTYALVAAATLMPMFPAAVTPRLFLVKGIRGAIGLSCSDLLRRLYAFLDHRSASRWTRGVAIAGAHLMLGALWYLLFLAATSPFQPPNRPHLQWGAVPHNSIDSVLVLATWSALYFGIAAWQNARVAAERATEAAGQAERAHLAALRYQLNPHFLFNALNSIRCSILKEPARAQDALTRLADLLRHTVYAPHAEWTTLREELEWVRNYLALEQLRFEDRLIASVEIEEAVTACLVPTFLLHPLVENAIKHGPRTSPMPLRVRISASKRGETVEIAVANTGRLMETQELEQDLRDRDARGVGLANLRERLAILDRIHNRLDLTDDDAWVRASVIIAQPSAPTQT